MTLNGGIELSNSVFEGLWIGDLQNRLPNNYKESFKLLWNDELVSFSEGSIRKDFEEAFNKAINDGKNK